MIIASAVVGAFLLWYLWFGTEYFLNGGASGRDPLLMPFQCFWEEVLQNIPGGGTRKALVIRKNAELKPHGAVVGSHRMWRYADVVARSCYRECAHDVLRSPLEFWATVAGVLTVGFLVGMGVHALFVQAYRMLVA